MKKIFLSFLLSTFALNGFCAENKLDLNAEQIKNLGIHLGKPVQANKIPVLFAPASVMIPPNNEYVISASQAGIISQLRAALGDEIQKGAILAQIESPELLTLQSQYLKALTALHLANTSYNRDKKLVQDGIIASRRLQETQAQYSAASVEVNQAKQLLNAAGMPQESISQLEKSQKLNSHLTIQAPISGVIIERMAIAGKRIDNLTPLYRMANLNTLWLEIAIPQERIGDIKIGDEVIIENTPTVVGEISLLGQSVNAEDQTIVARAVVKNAQTHIRSGQKLNVQILQTSPKIAYKVPNSAIIQNDGKNFIFIKNNNGFAIQQIDVIGKQGDDSIISGNLTQQQEIAVKGAVVLKANWLGVGSDE